MQWQPHVPSHPHRAMLQALCIYAAARNEEWTQYSIMTELCNGFSLLLASSNTEVATQWNLGCIIAHMCCGLQCRQWVCRIAHTWCLHAASAVQESLATLCATTRVCA